VPIVIWAIAYNIISMLAGFVLTKLFRMPDWATPAIAFNNTTSLPLLLVQSLEATGILAAIDDSSDVVARAKSYFLINSMIGNSLTFALGPRLLNGHEEDAPNEEKDEDDDDDGGDNQDATIESQEEEAEHLNEQTSLLPNRIARDWVRAEYRGYKTGKRYWKELPPWSQYTLVFLYSFFNPATIGAVIGILLGLVPPLHRLFFNDQHHGGFFNGWLTSATQNIGDLFASLQVVVVGVKLSNALVRMKNGEASGRVPWLPMVLISIIRFLIWPAISIPVIYLLASKTNLLSNDPIVWFTMMLMPVGPPALKLSALADVNGADDNERMSIAKFLTVISSFQSNEFLLMFS